MEVKDLICIGCPMGCMMKVKMEHGKVESVEGNTCKRGEIYAKKEVTNPMRIITSSVPVIGGQEKMVSVKTESDIPKGKMVECMRALKGISAKAPIHIGDVVAENIADTGVNIIATKEIL